MKKIEINRFGLSIRHYNKTPKGKNKEKIEGKKPASLGQVDIGLEELKDGISRHSGDCCFCFLFVVAI